MWLRRLLVAAYGLEETAAHRPGDVAWEELPERCVLQLHWRRTRELVELFDGHGFKVVVLARDPLDVLVSILHFAPQEPQTAEWLDGEAGDESTILGVEPGSAAFRAYALGPRAAALLSVTPEWWAHADARVRYEKLVADTAGVLGGLVKALGAEPLVPVSEAAASVRFADLQREATNGHFWQGRAGVGRELIPPELAREIAELGYAV